MQAARQPGKSGLTASQAGRQVSLASLANVLSPGLSPELIPVVVIYKIGIQGAALRCLTLQLIMLYSDNLHYDRHTYTTHVTVCLCALVVISGISAYGHG